MKEAESLLGSVFSTARHLVLTAVLPGTLLLGGFAAIVASCGFTAAPSLEVLGNRVAELSGRDLGIAFLAGTIVGILLRPVQFPFTQFLEGYWGSGAVASSVSAVLRKRAILTVAGLGEKTSGACAWTQHSEVVPLVRRFDPLALHRLRLALAAANSSADDPFSTQAWRRRVQQEEAYRLLARYPVQPFRIMPTRLGNALRAGEDGAGAPYGLEIIQLSGHLHTVAPPDHVAGVEGPRTQLDVSVTLCAVFIALTLVSLVAYINDGFWLLSASGFFLLAWVSYLGAVSAATEYTASLSVLIDLNRFRLYEALRISPPRNLSDERRRVAPVVSAVLGQRAADYRLAYQVPPARE